MSTAELQDEDQINTILSIANLPVEILEQIFLHLDPRSLAVCSLTCMSWRNLISQSQCIWKNQCFKLKDSAKQIKRDRRKGLSWKESFEKNYGRNGVKRLWKKGRCSNPKSYQELPDRVFCRLDAESWGQVFQWELERS